MKVFDYSTEQEIKIDEKFANPDVITKIKNCKENILFDVFGEKLSNLKKLDDKVSNKVIYKVKDHWGRFYANKQSLQNVNKEIRRLVCDDKYFEIDIKNSQPTILFNLCNKYGIECPVLNDYVENRDDKLKSIMEEYSVNKNDAKELILRITYGGDLGTWKKDCKVNTTKPATEFINNFVNELQRIIQHGAVVFPTFKDLIEYTKDQKKRSPSKAPFSALAVLLQDLERKVIFSLYNYLKMNDIPVNALIHDGILIEKRFSSLIDLEHAQRKIFENTEILVSLDEKDIDVTDADKTLYDTISNNQNEDTELVTEHYLQITNRFMSIFKGKIVKYNGEVYMYDDDEGIWSIIENKVSGKNNGVLIRMSYKHIKAIWFPNKSIKETNTILQDDKNPFNLQVSLSGIINLIFSHVPKTDSLETKSIQGLLPFQNGVLDMYTYQILPHSPEYGFTFIINRDFICDAYDYEPIYNRMFNKMYNTKNYHLRDFLIQKIARGVAGCNTDKQIVILIGETNCGKGKLTSLCKKALGEYTQNFNLENLYPSSRGGGDAEIDLMFVANICDARLQFSQEVDMTNSANKLDGNKIKKTWGGDDILSVRKKYGNIINVINRGTGFCMCNDVPKIQPADNAVLNRLNVIEVDRTSSDFIIEDNDTHFVRDSTIDAFVQDLYNANAFIYLMSLQYKLSVDQPLIPKPIEVTSAGTRYTEADSQGLNWFKTNTKYEIIGLKDEWIDNTKSKKSTIYNCKIAPFVSFKQLWEEYNTENSGVSANKFTTYLTKLGLTTQRRMINGRNDKAIIGIKEIDDVEYED